MRAAAANPEDEAPLIEDGLSPIDDPAEALSWVERMAEHGDDTPMPHQMMIRPFRCDYRVMSLIGWPVF